MSENPVISPLLMDRSEPIGNSTGDDGRRALHIKPTAGTLVTEPFNQIQGAYPDEMTEVYSFYLDAALQATVTVIYVDDTKDQILSVTKV